jgi:hypothetical protein
MEAESQNKAPQPQTFEKEGDISLQRTQSMSLLPYSFDQEIKTITK